jgi:WD40 repeat protein
VGNLSGAIHLLDAATGKELRRLETGDKIFRWKIFRLAFRPDSQSVASVEAGGLVRLWDTATGAILRQLKIGTDIHNIVFSADTNVVAGVQDSDGQGSRVFAWDISNGKRFGPIPVLQNQNVRVATSATGDLLATWGDFQERESEQEKRQEITHTIQICKTANAQEVHRLSVPHLQRGSDPIVNAVAFSPDSLTLAAATEANTILLWDLATGQERRRLTGRPQVGSLLAFSPDGKVLATSTARRHPSNADPIQLWETAKGKHLDTFAVSPCWSLGLVFTPEGSLQGCAEGASMVRLWNVRTGKTVGPDVAHAAPITELAYTPNGRRVISVDFDGAVCGWDVLAGAHQYRAQMKGWGAGHLLDPNRRALSGNARYLAGILGLSDQLGVWDVTSGEPVFPVMKTRSVLRITLSVDGNLLVGSGSDGMIYLWDARTGKELRRWQGPPFVAWMYLAADNQTLTEVSVPRGDTGKAIAPCQVHQWDIHNGTLLCQFALKGESFLFACLAPSGQVLVVASWGDDGIRLSHVPSGVELRAFGGSPNYQVSGAVALSPDGRTFAVAGREGPAKPETLRLWELASGRVRREFPLDQASFAIAFSPDGRTLATGCFDTSIVLWDLSSFPGEGKAGTGVLTTNKLEALWSDLSGPDAQKSYRASWALTLAPAQAVPFLKKHLRPVPRKPDQTPIITRLIQDLEDDQFAVRENAMRKLEAVGKNAQAALQTALNKKPSLELRRRVEALLKKLEGPEPALDLPSERALEVLEHIGNGDVRQLLQALAAGEPAAPLTRDAKATLERLLRRPAPPP